tara:strand:+ start:1063 stop:1461 length:399 start_codon:yes stop_codon:yes gene_type:complete
LGLDQYLVAQKENENNTETGDFFGNPSSNVVVEQLGVWRKHANLQGLMQNLAVEKGVVDRVDDFNCVDLPLTKEDLAQVTAAISLNLLPATTGFFFGASYGDDAEKQRDLLIFDEAISYANMGWNIVYRCWW